MARQANKLTAKQVEKTHAPGMYGDGLGLWLQVKEVQTKDGPSIAKSWVFRYRGRYLGLGPTYTVNLAEARVRARQARQIILDGEDPIEVKRTRRDEARALNTERMLFRDAAEEFLALHKEGWKNAKHRQQWANTLKSYAYPTLGARPLSAIDGALINEALGPIWTKKPETARRVKQRIERVVQWAKEGKPLPRQGPTKRVRHHPALPVAEIPAFMAELRARDSVSARALEFTILTAARTGEALGATWSEIDTDSGIWTVPAERMKGAKEHEVPLSRRAIEVLEKLPRERGGYVFPGARAKQPLSNMAMLQLLRGMREEGLTVHGFRSTFRDWAGDRTNFPRDVIEHALAHHIKDKSEAAYRRSAALEKRRKLMEGWAGYCSSPARAPGDVVALRA